MDDRAARLERLRRAGDRAEYGRPRREGMPSYPRKRKQSAWVTFGYELAFVAMCLSFGFLLVLSVSR